MATKTTSGVPLPTIDPFKMALGGQATGNAFSQATAQSPAVNPYALATGRVPAAPVAGGMSAYNPATAYTRPSTPIAPVAPVAAISASNLTPQPTPVYPTPTAPVAAQNTLQSSLAALQQQALALQSTIQNQGAAGTTPTTSGTATGSTTGATTDSPSSRGGILDRILGFQTDIANKGAFTQDANKEAGVNDKAAEVTRLTNEYNARERYYTKEIEKITKQNAKGTGAEVGAAQIQQLTQQKNAELADIAISSAAAQGNYKLAQDIAKQAVDAKYEPITAQIDLLKTYYQLSADDLTESEKLLAQEKIQEKQATVAFDRDKELYEYKQKIDQQDPMYKANLANIYSQISARAAESVGNANGTLNGKPQTTAQGLVQGYADRLAQSDVTINKIGANFTGASSVIGQALWNPLKSADRQVYEQAQRNFVNAILRRESGAAIAPSEFKSAATQYFPQPGDKPQVVAAKAQNRQTVINSLYNQANVAQPVLPGSVIDYDGKSYQVGDDGETLTEL